MNTELDRAETSPQFSAAERVLIAALVAAIVRELSSEATSQAA